MTAKMYMVKVIPGGKPLSYREVGGKKYTRKDEALRHLDSLRAKGVMCDLYEAEVEWKCIDAYTPPDTDTLFDLS